MNRTIAALPALALLAIACAPAPAHGARAELARVTQTAPAEVYVEPGLVHITWTLEGWTGGEVEVQRSHEGDPWKLIAYEAPDDAGRVSVRDFSAMEGERYAYRLRSIETREVLTDEVSITSPSPLSLSVRPAAPHPSRTPLRLLITVPDLRPVWLEVVDAAGRRVASSRSGVLGYGTHEVVLPETAGLRPGVYFAKLAGGTVTRRTSIVVAR
jgi:hypothetical protein